MFVCFLHALLSLYTVCVNDDSPQFKLNALVGAALRGLVQSGADDQAIGAFAAEHRERVAQILGMAAAPVAPVDLQAVIESAVAQGIEKAQSQGRLGKARRQAGAARRVYVVVAGVRTSVTIPSALFEEVAAAGGGAKEARRLAEQYANQAPDEGNRSGWTVERLRGHLALHEAPGAAQPRH